MVERIQNTKANFSFNLCRRFTWTLHWILYEWPMVLRRNQWHFSTEKPNPSGWGEMELISFGTPVQNHTLRRTSLNLHWTEEKAKVILFTQLISGFATKCGGDVNFDFLYTFAFGSILDEPLSQRQHSRFYVVSMCVNVQTIDTVFNLWSFTVDCWRIVWTRLNCFNRQQVSIKNYGNEWMKYT